MAHLLPPGGRAARVAAAVGAGARGSAAPPPLGGTLHDPYQNFYADNTNDPFNGCYQPAYEAYNLARVTPQVLWDHVYCNGNAGINLAHLLLVHPTTQVGEGPGTIYSYHHFPQYNSCLGQPPTAFNNCSMAFIGDIVNGQAPTMVQIANTYFHQASVVQTPTVACINQLLAADLNLQLLGPYNVGDPDVEDVNVWCLVFIPNPYLALILSQGLTPREAWEQIWAQIVTNGVEPECQPLIDWLSVALTCMGPNQQPQVIIKPPALVPLVAPQDTAAFTAYCLLIIHHDLPDLNASVMQWAWQIAEGLMVLAGEQCQTCLEAEQHRVGETNKMLGEYFATSLA